MGKLNQTCRTIGGCVVVLLFFGGSKGTEGMADKNSDLCLAFLRLGDVVLHCGGDDLRVTKGGDIESFAVSDTTETLAFVRSRRAREPNAASYPVLNATVVDLRKGKTRGVPSDGALLDTCGGVFDLLDRPHERSGTTDLVTGAAFSPPGFVYFRCSADRKVIAGTSSAGEAEVFVRSAGDTRQLGRWSPPYSLGVSPEGAYVAYASDTSPLCVVSMARGAACAPADSAEAFHEVISVSDNGRALVAVHTREVCRYRSSAVFYATRDLASPDLDMCLGIGFWEAGMASIKIIEPIGRSPQWIKPGTAASLRRWAR